MASTPPVYFHYHEITYRVTESANTKLLLWRLFKQESRKLARIDYILSTDAYLLELNQAYLQHDYYTDVITFDYSDQDLPEADRPLTGEVYISIDRIRENAERYKVTVARELLRVMIHGALHLCGYNDSTPTEKADMTAKEDYYLSLL